MSFLEPSDTVGEWSLRISIAAIFLFASVNKVTAPENGQIFEALLGVSSPVLVFGTGLALIISSVMLLSGFGKRIAAGFATLFLAVSFFSGLIAGGPMFTVGPAIWKDAGLLAGSLALFYWE